MKISVITATYNSVRTLEDCLDSVRRQSHALVEHIVIDGVSSDGTLELLQARRADLDVLVSEPDRGIYDALNKGLALASGDVVGFLHSDDFYAADDVLACVAAAFDDADVDAVYGDLDYVRQQDVSRRVRRWQAGSFRPSDLKLGWMPPHPTLFVRRGGYQRIGGFDLRFRIAADYLSVLQLFSTPGFNTVYLPRVLVKMRLGGASNGSLSSLMRKSREDLAALRLTGVGGPLTLVAKNLRKLPQFL
jgi:glycosyltransferase involved in cell wall biosynthesis